MSLRTAVRLAWSLWGLSVGAVVLSAPLAALNGFELGFNWVFGGVTAAAFSSVGVVVASRRPENAVGWLFCVIGLCSGVLVFSAQYALYGLFTRAGALPAAGPLVSLTFFLAGVMFGLLITFALLLFPDGRLPSRRWRPVAWISAAGVVFMSVGLGLGALQMGGRDLAARLVRGAEVVPAESSGLAGTLNGVGHVLVFMGFAAAIVSLFVRRRSATRAERQQLKWFAYGAATFALAILSYALPWPERISEALELATAVFLPVAIGIAVLRYRLYDIDVIINRTLVYGALTAALVAVYFGGVVGLQRLLSPLVGESGRFAVVVSTLAIAALFSPLRRRIQSVIDRRFYRRKYDAAKTLEAFSVKLRNETDLESLRSEVLAVVRGTVQPENVSLWLREPSGNASRNAFRTGDGYAEVGAPESERGERR